MSAHAIQVECKQGDKIEVICRELGVINKTLFLGNGQPPVVTQMAVLRDTVDKLCWLVGITCAAVVTQIVIVVAEHLNKG